MFAFLKYDLPGIQSKSVKIIVNKTFDDLSVPIFTPTASGGHMKINSLKVFGLFSLLYDISVQCDILILFLVSMIWYWKAKLDIKFKAGISFVMDITWYLRSITCLNSYNQKSRNQSEHTNLDQSSTNRLNQSIKSKCFRFLL